MSKNTITNANFKSKVIGVDPITKGTFTIEHAWMLWDEWDTINGCVEQESFYQGKIVITSEKNNPLYKIAKEQPLRLQGLIASVNFGIEKRFIKIRTISEYNIFPSMNGIEQIDLNPVTFEILDNLEYLENVQTYREDNLL
jgi:hypothetical protein